MTSQPVPDRPPPRFALLIVFLTVFIDLLGFRYRSARHAETG